MLDSLWGLCRPSYPSFCEAGHPDATDLTRDFSPGNSDAMDILTIGLGLGLGLELGRQHVPGLKNTEVNFLVSGRSRQDVADPHSEGKLCGDRVN